MSELVEPISRRIPSGAAAARRFSENVVRLTGSPLVLVNSRPLGPRPKTFTCSASALTTVAGRGTVRGRFLAPIARADHGVDVATEVGFDLGRGPRSRGPGSRAIARRRPGRSPFLPPSRRRPRRLWTTPSPLRGDRHRLSAGTSSSGRTPRAEPADLKAAYWRGAKVCEDQLHMFLVTICPGLFDDLDVLRKGGELGQMSAEHLQNDVRQGNRAPAGFGLRGRQVGRAPCNQDELAVHSQSPGTKEGDPVESQPEAFSLAKAGPCCQGDQHPVPPKQCTRECEYLLRGHRRDLIALVAGQFRSGTRIVRNELVGHRRQHYEDHVSIDHLDSRWRQPGRQPLDPGLHLGLRIAPRGRPPKCGCIWRRRCDSTLAAVVARNTWAASHFSA